MGGGKEKSEDGATPRFNPASLSLSVTCQYSDVPLVRGRQLPCSLLAKIKAVSEMNEDRRAPVTVIATIDRSASMKDKLSLVQESLNFVVQQLRHDDKLALITFDHEVEVLLPLTSMTSPGKQTAKNAISSIKERGHTNLSGGLLAALQMLYGIAESDSTIVESVVLFTDGKANYGIKDPEGLAKATKSMISHINRQLCVFTMGYGSDHDPDMLHAVANAGNGLFYYIENKDNIPDSFCDCLGGLLSVAAQNVVLTISADKDSCFSMQPPQTLYATVPEGDRKTFKVTIPDVYCEEEKCIPIHMNLSTRSDNQIESKLHLLTCSMTYFDVLNCQPQTVAESCHVIVDQSISQPITDPSYHEDIELHTVRFEVADSLKNASMLADQGNIDNARAVLHRCKDRIKKSVVFGQPVAQYFMETIDESLGGLESSVKFKSVGKPTMMTYSDSLHQQRSSGSHAKPRVSSYGSDYDPYANAMKKKMKCTYAEVYFDKK